jgi:hypothetical protein
MGILLAFAPFIAFAVIDRIVGADLGLVAGALVSLALVLREWLNHRSLKILEVGTAALFCGLAVYAYLGTPDWSVISVRLCVDTGLLLIVLLSMAVGKPFTLQYARVKAAPQHWASPTFVRTNYIITAVWAAAFAVMVVAEATLLYMPDVPKRVGVFAIVAALVAAVKFTGWYPEHVKARHAAS